MDRDHGAGARKGMRLDPPEAEREEKMAIKNPSPQQVAIFEEFRHGTGHLVLDARAGTGKTTTILEGIELAPESRIVMCAFNKVIAEELKTRLRNPRASARTLHSLGNGIVLSHWNRVTVDDRRGQRLASKAIGVKNPPREIPILVKNTAAIGKNVAPFATVEQLRDLAVEFDFVPENKDLMAGEEPWTVEQVASAAHKAMELATERDGTIDFDDMVWLPVRMGWARPQFDLVVIDECQDMNATQIQLARMVCNARGRIVVVGDPHQAIYGFRGADSSSMARLEKELSAKRLGLTTTYRCPQKVVALAQRYVPDFHAAPSAPEGIVRDSSTEKLLDETRPGDFVLSRTNAPLARICLKLLRHGKKAIIRGRDVGRGLLKIIEKLEARDIPELMKLLGAWETSTVKTLEAQDAPDSKIDFVHDQADTIRDLSVGLASIAELRARLESLFSDNNIGSAIICSTVHKAKGLESERVFILEKTLFPGGRTSDQEEQNIAYVAITRSKNELVMVQDLPS